MYQASGSSLSFIMLATTSFKDIYVYQCIAAILYPYQLFLDAGCHRSQPTL